MKISVYNEEMAIDLSRLMGICKMTVIRIVTLRDDSEANNYCGANVVLRPALDLHIQQYQR